MVGKVVLISDKLMAYCTTMDSAAVAAEVNAIVVWAAVRSGVIEA